MSGPHFRDYHLMLDEQSDQIFSMTDVIAERARKLGASRLENWIDETEKRTWFLFECGRLV
jgi:starvation-inducible DNA-binding protein